MDYGAYEASSVERILMARFKPRTLESQIADSARNRIRDLMRDRPVRVRPLKGYTSIRTGDTQSHITGETSVGATQDISDQTTHHHPDATTPDTDTDTESEPGSCAERDPESSC
jgi:hypothetical protein